MPKNPNIQNAYSDISTGVLDPSLLIDENPTTPQSFSGGDLFAYINNIQVGNLESITWSSSVEVVGNFTMGNRNVRQYTTGKRVIVGSLMFAQYDRHALLEQVFKVSSRGRTKTMADLWNDNSLTTRLANRQSRQASYASTTGGGTGSRRSSVTADASYDMEGIARGISREEFARQQDEMSRLAREAVGKQEINYSDQIKPFDLTLVGVSQTGVNARCTLFGIQTTQETGGFSMQDLGNSVGFSFVAKHVNPWRRLDD